MQIKHSNASDAPKPSGAYSQAVSLESHKRLLFISGQIPESKDGDVPASFEEQARMVWQNVIAQLHAADMTIANLVKVTIFLATRKDRETNSAVRQEILNGHETALTVIIAEIYDPAWLLEIEAIAAA